MDSLIEEIIKQKVLQVGIAAIAAIVSISVLLSERTIGLAYALVISLRKTERIMQPPRHMSAISGLLSFHLYSFAACSNCQPIAVFTYDAIDLTF